MKPKLSGQCLEKTVMLGNYCMGQACSAFTLRKHNFRAIFATSYQSLLEHCAYEAMIKMKIMNSCTVNASKRKQAPVEYISLHSCSKDIQLLKSH